MAFPSEQNRGGEGEGGNTRRNLVREETILHPPLSEGFLGIYFAVLGEPERSSHEEKESREKG